VGHGIKMQILPQIRITSLGERVTRNEGNVSGAVQRPPNGKKKAECGVEAIKCGDVAWVSVSVRKKVWGEPTQQPNPTKKSLAEGEVWEGRNVENLVGDSLGGTLTKRGGNCSRLRTSPVRLGEREIEEKG